MTTMVRGSYHLYILGVFVPHYINYGINPSSLLVFLIYCTAGGSQQQDIDVGFLYEIDHTKLPPRSPAHLRSLRVVMVSIYLSLYLPTLTSSFIELSFLDYSTVLLLVVLFKGFDNVRR